MNRMKTGSSTRVDNWWKRSAALLVCCTLLFMPIQSQAWSGGFLEAVKAFVQEMHIDAKSDEVLLEGALKGMLSSLDPYSEFLNREETLAYQNSLSGQIAGIGVVLGETEAEAGGVRILSILPDSPAEQAGLREGDILVKAEGQSLAGKTPAEAAALIRGEPGTSVTLTIRRGGDTLVRELKRRTIRVSPLSWRIQDGIGMIRITQFSRGMATELAIALTEIRKAGVHRLMLDLRDNPGGYVDEAVEAARLLIPPGPVVSLDYRSERMGDVSYGSSNPDPGWIIAVLVNKSTASAAEILAGAIQDAGKGFLVGQTTYGKGVMQNLFMILTPEAYETYGDNYPDQFVSELEWAALYGVRVKPEELLGMARITTGRYLTRNGRALDKIGLAPDLAAEILTRVNELDLSQAEPIRWTKTLSLNAYDPAVRQAEVILKAAGLLDEYPDSLFDERTKSALTAWQAQSGLPKNGTLDTDTAASLNKRLEKLRMESDPAYASAKRALNLFSAR